VEEAMVNRTFLLGGAVLLMAAGLGGGAIITWLANSACAATKPPVSFTEDIAPLLQWRCGSCHQPGGQGYEKSGYNLTTYEGVMKGTKFGPMVIPGDPDTSSLMRLLDWKVSPEIRMPHGKKQLSVCDRDAIREWIRQGAMNN
jgi:hypothetical protein